MKSLRSLSPASWRFRTRRASSLLLVLWAIMLMSFTVMGLVEHLSRGLDESIASEKEFRARLMLQSARNLAGHPAIERGEPLLHQRLSATRSFDVVLTSEGTRIAVNQLAGSATQRKFAQRLFEKWGMDTKQAMTLAESIADWTDPGDRPHTHGAERDYYTTQGRPDFPFNGPFGNIDDLLLVRGSDEMNRLRPDWRNWFTIYGDGTIDVHLASSEMLEALLDVTSAEIGRFMRARNGPDGLPETIDDPRFTALPAVRRLLDVPQANYTAVAALLTLDHPVKRTECFSRAGSLERRLTIIAGGGVNIVREE